jgi:hypothetical protein
VPVGIGEVEVHAAAFVVALLRAGLIDEAFEFVEWYQENVGDSERLVTLVESEEA